MAATDLERLLVSIEAQTSQFDKKLAKLMSDTDRSANRVQARFDLMCKQINGSFGRVAAGLVPSLGGVVSALGAREILAYAEAWTAAQNTLKTAGVAGDQVGVTLDTIYNIAQRQGTALAPLVTLYGRVAQAGKDLGASASDQAQFTEGVATALRVAGTNSEAASGALLQLSQLLGSGTVHAEEFNSVMEGARPILQAVADGLEGAGGSVSRLRSMVMAGTVTSKDFFQAFLKGMDGLESQAAKATDTVEQSLSRLLNALTRYVGQTDATLGATTRISQGLTLLAQNFDTIANAALIVGTALGVGFVTNALRASTILQAIGSVVGVAVGGLNGVQASITAAAVSARIGTAAMSAFRVALSLLGGPVGVALTGVAVALAVASSRTVESEARWAKYADTLQRVQKATNGTAAATGAAAKKFSEEEANRLNAALKQQTADLQTAAAELEAGVTKALTVARGPLSSLANSTALTDLEQLQGGLGDTAEAALKAKDELFRLANADPKFQGIADRLAPLLTKLASVRAAIAETRTSLANVGQTPAALIDAQVGKLPPAHDASTDPNLNSLATQAFIKQQTQAYDLAARERKIQADAEGVYNDALAHGIELTKAQARGIAEYRDNAERAAQSLDKLKAYQQGLKGYGLATSEMELEARLIGQNTYEATRQLEVLRLVNQAKMDHVALTPQLLAAIDGEAARRAAATAGLEQAHDAQQRWMDLQQEFGNVGISSLQGLIDGTKSFNDVLKDSIGTLSQMILKAAVLGEGPLAGIFGASSTSTSTGGLIGALFGGFRADGGPVAPGKTYMVGERGPELFTPGRSGFITPNTDVAPAASGGMTFAPSYSVDARGSQMGEAQFAAMLSAHTQELRRAVPGWVENARSRQISSKRS